MTKRDLKTDKEGLENAEYRRKFSERLQKALNLLGIGGRGKFKWLSDATGVSQQNVRKWLSGESLPEMRKIPELAKRLGVRLEWLIGDSGDMVRDDKTIWIPVISWRDVPRWLDPGSRNDVEKLDTLPFSGNAGPDTFAVAMQGAKLEPGARNTFKGGLRPDRSADFFVPRFILPFPSASSCRVWAEYKTLRGNHARRPLTVSSARRPFRASPHRLEIDQRSPS